MQLYKISFTSTNKVYIGISSKSAARRFKDHCREANQSLIAKAIRKHEGVILTVISECDNWDDLCKMEIDAIASHNSQKPNGYNLSGGGKSLFGFKHSDETKAKISVSKNNMSQEIRDKIAEGNRLRSRRPETLARLRVANFGKKASLETRAKMSLAAKNHSPESRLKISIANIGRIKSQETCVKLSKAKTGLTLSQETRAKISYAAINISDETRLKMSVRAKNISDEIRLKMSISNKQAMTDEKRRKISIAGTGRKQSQEEREKRSVALKLFHEKKRQLNLSAQSMHFS